jgi:hypothetical protein
MKNSNPQKLFWRSTAFGQEAMVRKGLDEAESSSIIYRPLMEQVCTQLRPIKTSLHGLM